MYKLFGANLNLVKGVQSYFEHSRVSSPLYCIIYEQLALLLGKFLAID